MAIEIVGTWWAALLNYSSPRNLFTHLTTSNQITDAKPITQQTASCHTLNQLKPKKRANGFTYSSKAQMPMVMTMINGTRLFLYRIVVMME